MTRTHSTSKHDRRSILRLLCLFILAVCCHPATARPPANNALVSSSSGSGSSKGGALAVVEHSTYGNTADRSGGSSSSKSSSIRGTLSAAEHSTYGGAAEHSSGGRWSAAQGLLRLRAGPGRRKRSQWAALDSLLDRYAERHKRCLFDQKYKGQYVIVSMGDSFSGDWLRLSDAQIMFLPGLPAWKDFRAARPIPQGFSQPQQQGQAISTSLWVPGWVDDCC